MFDNKNNLTFQWRNFPGKTCSLPPTPPEYIHQAGGHMTTAASAEGDTVSVKRCFDTLDFWKTAPCVYREAFPFVITSFQTNLLTQLTEAPHGVCSEWF